MRIPPPPPHVHASAEKVVHMSEYQVLHCIVVALKAPLQGPHQWRAASCCPRANGRVRSLFAPKSQGDSHPPHGNKTTSPRRAHGPNERRGGRKERALTSLLRPRKKNSLTAAAAAAAAAAASMATDAQRYPVLVQQRAHLCRGGKGGGGGGWLLGRKGGRGGGPAKAPEERARFSISEEATAVRQDQ